MSLLFRPLRVFIILTVFVTGTLLLNGSFFQLYKLHRDRAYLQTQIQATRGQIAQLDRQLKLVRDPVYLEHQALENYDLARENDLIFIFSEESN